MNIAQRAFSHGEIGPALWARTDLAQYAAGARTMRNFIAQRFGGVTNRPGTELVSTLPGVAAARLLPFEFNDDQSYVLEFTALTLRFISDGGYVVSGALPVSLVTPYLAGELAALQIAQSGDVVTIVHPAHPVMELRRFGHTSWTLSAVVFAPDIAPPVGLIANPGFTTPGTNINWVVTALSEKSGAESYASSSVGVMTPQANELQLLSWSAVPGADGYNVYKSYNAGTFGFVGTTNTPYFTDAGLTPDFANQPPQLRPLFAAAGDYPSAVGNYQQRRIVASTDTAPATCWTSRSGDFDNFLVSIPTQDDDAVTFTLVSRKVNRIRHIVDADTLYLLTSGGEWVIRGDGAGIIRPTDINALNFSKHGSSPHAPIVIDSRVLYIQARQTVVREIRGGEVQFGYEGNDLTLLSTHLFEGYTLTDWAYQEIPHSVIWCVRSDGVLLGLTTLDEQKVLAWHRHDTDGTVEQVCVVPEGGEDRLYLVVKRNGMRMVERMASRHFLDVQDAIFTDSTLTYDGRNGDLSHTMTLSGGSAWDEGETLTITSSAPLFDAGEIGNAIHLTAEDGSTVRFRLEALVSANVMTGHVTDDVPADLQGVATAAWARAVETFDGLGHLEGKALSVVGDGHVIASPNNPLNTLDCIVTGGQIVLDAPYAYLHAGLPYLSDLGTLDIDSAGGASMKDRKMLINRVSLMLQDSRGAFVGRQFPTGSDPVEDMDELKVRDESDDFGPIALQTTTLDVAIKSQWDSSGSVAIRNVDPIPLTILAVIPRGHLAQAG